MYNLYSLFSSSSGNSTYIGNRNKGILVDIGKSAKQTINALKSADLSPESIQAIFITHEHIDHVAGLRVFCNKYNIPVYSSGGTLEALDRAGHLSGDFPVYQIFDKAEVGDFSIRSFRTSHDTAESMGYRITLPNLKEVAVCTDLGYISDDVSFGIDGVDAILLESNHDIQMLQNGPYPYSLIRRVMSDKGHLSNPVSAAKCVELVKGGAKSIMLAHLSKISNTPDLAYQTTASELELAGIKVGSDVFLDVAAPDDVVVMEV